LPNLKYAAIVMPRISSGKIKSNAGIAFFQNKATVIVTIRPKMNPITTPEYKG